MDVQIGIVFALVALFGWAFGDFFIQRTTRLVGGTQTLFLIGGVGCIALFPFVWKEIPTYTTADYLSLVVLSFVILLFAIALFEALRRGKLSVVESVVAFELPLTVALGIFVGGESLTSLQMVMLVVIGAGIILAVTTHAEHLHLHRRMFEKGVALAFVGAFFSALTNFYIGSFSQHLSPLMVIWATHGILALWCALYMLVKNEWKVFGRNLRAYPVTLLGMGAIDNVAWIGYSHATTYIPISLTTMISESYIALAALLGYVFGKEKLRRHQIVGAIIACSGAVILSFFVPI